MARIPAEKKEKSVQSPKLQRVVRTMQCTLTEAELETLGKEVADLTSNIDEKAAEISQLKDDSKHLSEVRSSKALQRRRGFVDRDVECEWSLEGATVTISRLDTGEILETRPATPDERQGSFGL